MSGTHIGYILGVIPSLHVCTYRDWDLGQEIHKNTTFYSSSPGSEWRSWPTSRPHTITPLWRRVPSLSTIHGGVVAKLCPCSVSCCSRPPPFKIKSWHYLPPCYSHSVNTGRPMEPWCQSTKRDIIGSLAIQPASLQSVYTVCQTSYELDLCLKHQNQ